MTDTIDYYNQRAEDYYQATVNLDLTEVYEPFLAQLAAGSSILDLGCGSGRDSLYFSNQGYQVTAVDGAEEMVNLSSKLLGQRVLHKRFNELEFSEQFAGIWACASLLHVRKKNITSVLKKAVEALVPGGIMYLSFKYGNQELIKEGRLFNYYDEQSFVAVVNQVNNIKLQRMWQTADKKQEQTGEIWLNVLLEKDT